MRATGYVERKLWEWKKGAGKGRGLIDGETTRRRDDVFMIRKRGEEKEICGQALRRAVASFNNSTERIRKALQETAVYSYMECYFLRTPHTHDVCLLFLLSLVLFPSFFQKKN